MASSLWVSAGTVLVTEALCDLGQLWGVGVVPMLETGHAGES